MGILPASLISLALLAFHILLPFERPPVRTWRFWRIFWIIYAGLFCFMDLILVDYNEFAIYFEYSEESVKIGIFILSLMKFALAVAVYFYLGIAEPLPINQPPYYGRERG